MIGIPLQFLRKEVFELFTKTNLNMMANKRIKLMSYLTIIIFYNGLEKLQTKTSQSILWLNDFIFTSDMQR